MHTMTGELRLRGIVMTAFLLIFFLANTMAFAEEGSKAQPITPAAEVESVSVFESVGGFMLSLVTPNEACAATDVLSCNDFCAQWRPIRTESGYEWRCVVWSAGAPDECKITY